jgi:hypothetical protein
MNCKSCGALITGTKEFCTNCGQVVSYPPPSGLRGVGGWLLLLCIMLAIVFPLNILYGTVRSLRYHPDGLVLLINAANVALGALSLAAGLMLWRVRKNAVILAKVFLLLSPVHAVAIFCLVVFSAHVANPWAMVSLALRILALPFLFSLLWFWYLLASKRVKSTFTVS